MANVRNDGNAVLMRNDPLILLIFACMAALAVGFCLILVDPDLSAALFRGLWKMYGSTAAGV